MADRFKDWQYPEIEEAKPTKYNWVVQNKDGFRLGYRTDIGAFTYINAKFGVTIEDEVQIGSHCSIYSVSTIDGRGAGGAEEGVPDRDAQHGNAGGDPSETETKRVSPRLNKRAIGLTGQARQAVGENAIIGAHSFVTRDVADGEVVVGVPAGKIGGPRSEVRGRSTDYPSTIFRSYPRAIGSPKLHRAGGAGAD